METDALVRCVGILRCPISGGALTFLSTNEIAAANARVAAGALLHRDGANIAAPLVTALGTADRRHLYRVEDSIACLLPELAIVAADVDVRRDPDADKKQIVKSYYDEFGWVKSSDGLFNDTLEFTDTRTSAREYQRRCHERIGAQLPGGRYLLDVASGAIPHVEYLEFGRNYETRICVDFSIRALREARAKLGSKGLYLLGDITQLPLASDAIDTVISLHTIYHVPREQQTQAVNEVMRVTRRGGRAVIVYIWSHSAAMNLFFGVRGMLGRVRRRLLGRPNIAVSTEPGAAPRDLYFSPQDYAWYKRDIAASHRAKLLVWSGISTIFQARFIGDDRFGRLTRSCVEMIEDTFPGLSGRYGQYPMFVLDKPQ